MINEQYAIRELVHSAGHVHQKQRHNQIGPSAPPNIALISPNYSAPQPMLMAIHQPVPRTYSFPTSVRPNFIRPSPLSSGLTESNDESVVLSESRLMKHLQNKLNSGSIVISEPFYVKTPDTIIEYPGEISMKKFIQESDNDDDEDEDDCDECREQDGLQGKWKSLSPRMKYVVKGFICIACAVLYVILHDPVMDFVLESQLQLNPGNLLVSMGWTGSPVSFSANLYLFEIRNGEQFLNGAPPFVKEIGPFVFKFGRQRRILEWQEDSVKFMEKLNAQFDPENSKYPLDHNLTMMNAPILATTSWAQYWMKQYMISFLNPVVHNVLSLMLQAFGEKLIEQRSAQEIILGRPINFLKFLDALRAPLRALDVPIPDYVEILTSQGHYKLMNQSFSIIGLITGMEFGPLEFYRHTTTAHRANQVKSLYGSQQYKHYKLPCNQITGTDPIFFGLHDQGQHLDVFQMHFCRNIRFNYNTSEYVDGVWAARYVADIDMFNMRRLENHCYCFGDRTLAQCDGYTDISGCFGGLPLALTHSHFLGSKRLQVQTFGLTPDPDRHLSRLDIEPYSGVICGGQIGFQYNLILKDFPRFGQLGHIRPGVLPFGFFKLSLKMDGMIGYVLKIQSFVLNYGKYVMATVFCITAIVYFFLAIIFHEPFE